MNRPEEEICKELYLSKSHIHEMIREEMYFGVHGHGHEWLGKMPTKSMQEDINLSLEYLVEDEIIDPDCWVMNYPYGSFSEEVIQCIQSKGCKIGLGVEAREANLNVDRWLTLPRFDTNDYLKRM